MQGDAKLAEQHFRTALRADDDAQAMAGLALLACDAGDRETALKYAPLAAKKPPQDAMAQYVFGRTMHLNGNLAFAEQAYINAISLRSGFGQAHAALAMLMLASGRAQEGGAAVRPDATDAGT